MSSSPKIVCKPVADNHGGGDHGIWDILDQYFQDNPRALVNHHLESFNDFCATGIHQIFRDSNPLTLVSQFQHNDYKHQCRLYFGGKDGRAIYFGKPVIYDKNHVHFMFPNEARLRNMTYGMSIHYDIECELIDLLDDHEVPNTIYVDEPAVQEMLQTENFQGIPVEAQENLPDELYLLYADGTRQRIQTSPSKKDQLRTLIQQHVKRVPIRHEGPVGSGLGAPPLLYKNVYERRFVLKQVYLGRFPIMLQSRPCILGELSREHRWACGECKNDLGGYFIIDGKEKVVIPQEKLADNTLNVRLFQSEYDEANDDVKTPKYLATAEIRSVSENIAKPRRTLAVQWMAPTSTLANRNMVVTIPNVRKPVPLFIVFRALGVISDKDIITTCLLDLNKYALMVDHFTESVHDAGGVLTQQGAMVFMALLTKGKTVGHVHEILTDYFLPHVGESNYVDKAYFLGHMVFQLLATQAGLVPPTDRDHFKHKRVEVVGSLIQDLFREYFTIQKKQYHLELEKKLYFNTGLYGANLYGLIQDHYEEVVGQRIVEQGFRKAFKGNWGALPHTKRIGIVQDLNRLSFNNMLNHLRKVCLPLDTDLKIVEPRKLHASQWGFVDPLDTPDGGNIGFHKHLAMMTTISRATPRAAMFSWLQTHFKIYLLNETRVDHLAQTTKLFINGCWMGGVKTPQEVVDKIKLHRRNGLIPLCISVTFDMAENGGVLIFTDMGRLCRPVFYYEQGQCSLEAWLALSQHAFSWADLVSGKNPKRIQPFDPYSGNLYALSELYEGTEGMAPEQLHRFLSKKGVVDYIDSQESEQALILMAYQPLKGAAPIRYTHCEIHPSLMFGIMCNQIPYAEHNQAPRDIFSCGQSKQACSVYHTNYQVRVDKSALVLNYGQMPLVKTRYSTYLHHDEQPYGENAIVAIMCYTGYNVEDAILINEAAMARGLFRTSYYTTYGAHEERQLTHDEHVSDVLLTNPKSAQFRPNSRYNYTKLDAYGIIRPGEPVDENTVLICMTKTGAKEGERVDCSVTPKKGQAGVVDRCFVTEGAEGERIIKVRLLEQRIPALGDKVASRVGQKGTVGMVVRECDMPFAMGSGMRPDIIINPHAIPSRMTIGQIMECVAGKASSLLGGYADSTAFTQRSDPSLSKSALYGEVLMRHGYHSGGNEVLLNGMTGEPIEADIFMGPTYYMRLKHMVKDKINYRRQGGMSVMTRQPMAGRANDGGLRMGGMERDVMVAHGTTEFLRESFMERSDKYQMTVCNKSGMMAVFNPSTQLSMSPAVDGPLQYQVNPLQPNQLVVQHHTRLGRDISVIHIPYAFKLFLQELQCMNVQMRLVTEDNVSPLETLPGAPLDPLTPNLQTHVQTVLYGWQKRFDDGRMRHIWKNMKTGKIQLDEPEVWKRYHQVAELPMHDGAYHAGDVVYYLDTTNPRGNPMIRWTIESIDEGQTTMTLVNADTGRRWQGVPYRPEHLRLLETHSRTDDDVDGMAVAEATAVVELEVGGPPLYGWKKEMSQRYQRPYWADVSPMKRPSQWTEPLELVRRREILAMPPPTRPFQIDDVIYDLSEPELNLTTPVDLAALNKMHLVTRSYYDMDTHLPMLKYENGAMVPYNPTVMRWVRVLEPAQDTKEKALLAKPAAATDDSPLFSPASPKAQVGGGGAAPHPHPLPERDQIVYKIGDVKPKRFWYVRDVDPIQHCVTIATEDGQGLETQDMMQMVDASEVILVPMEDLIVPEGGGTSTESSSSSSNTNAFPPGIVFNPVIKVISGDDNSVGGGSTPATTLANETTPMTPGTHAAAALAANAAATTTITPTPLHEPKHAPPSASDKEMTLGGSLAKAASFVVKKLSGS